MSGGLLMRLVPQWPDTEWGPTLEVAGAPDGPVTVRRIPERGDPTTVEFESLPAALRGELDWDVLDDVPEQLTNPGRWVVEDLAIEEDALIATLQALGRPVVVQLGDRVLGINGKHVGSALSIVCELVASYDLEEVCEIEWQYRYFNDHTGAPVSWEFSEYVGCIGDEWVFWRRGDVEPTIAYLGRFEDAEAAVAEGRTYSYEDDYANEPDDEDEDK